jgi:hypothetical protein
MDSEAEFLVISSLVYVDSYAATRRVTIRQDISTWYFRSFWNAIAPSGKSPSPTAANAGPATPLTDEIIMQVAQAMPESFFIIDCCNVGCDVFIIILKA